ncbi:MAG TPA: peptidase E [Mycobacteriales bacterium]|nr:peptidase E [Mycobacteriales bacterium]
MTDRHVLATSSGGFEPDDRYGARPGPLMRYAVELSGASTPRVCALHTATGDDAARRAVWYAAVAGAGWRPSHLALFPMPNVDDLTEHLLEQDVIWVGGGSVANLLALWRLHGVDTALREAWEAGVVLTGGSAGSLCWFEGGTTDSFGPQLRPVTNGLAFLPGSTCPHYDSEERRRPLYQQLVRDGVVPPGTATDDGVGLHYAGTELSAVVSDRGGAAAYRVDRDGETRIEPVRLG